jgi:hypothetical protein
MASTDGSPGDLQVGFTTSAGGFSMLDVIERTHRRRPANTPTEDER